MSQTTHRFPEALRAELREIVDHPTFLRAVAYLKEQNEPSFPNAQDPTDRLTAGALENAKQVGFNFAFKALN